MLFDLELLRKIAVTKPENLPALIVHSNLLWSGDPLPDSNGDVHMCEADFLGGVVGKLPVALDENLNDGTTRYRLQLESHHLVPTQDPGDTTATIGGRRSVLREAFPHAED